MTEKPTVEELRSKVGEASEASNLLEQEASGAGAEAAGAGEEAAGGQAGEANVSAGREGIRGMALA